MQVVLYHPRAASGDGGITSSVRRLSSALARAGAKPIVVCDSDAPVPDVDDGVEWRPVPHRRFGRNRLPRNLEDAIHGTDVVILNSAWTAHNVLAGRAARRVRVPYVLAPRGAYDPLILRRRRVMKRLWWTAWEAELTSRANAIHIFFKSQEQHLRALGYGGRIIVAPNGVVAPDDLRWNGASGSYLLYLGRFDPEHKGLDLLVQAIANVPSGSLPPVRLQGPDWQGGKLQVQRLVRKLDIEDRVEIHESVQGDAKWVAMAEARGFVYPSRWEGFGNSVAEAAALGVPILATPYPLSNFLAERHAVVLAPATVSGLSMGLRKLTSEQAAEVGRLAREAVRRHFSWDEVARSWLEQLPDPGRVW